MGTEQQLKYVVNRPEYGMRPRVSCRVGNRPTENEPSTRRTKTHEGARRGLHSPGAASY